MAYVTVARDRERAPGKPIFLRIDGNTPFSTYYKGWAGPEAAQIMNQLLRGRSVLTRHRAWPADQVLEQEISLEGIHEVWDYMQASVQGR
jgi:hypothetical protein